MIAASIGLAPAARLGGGFHVSTTVVIVVIVFALLAVLAILGWRAPDRSPGIDTKKQRERIED